MRQKKTTPAAPKPPARAIVGGKAPREAGLHEKAIKSSQATKTKRGTKDGEKVILPYKIKDAIKARRLAGPNNKTAQELRDTEWKDETYQLIAEKVQEPEALPDDYKIMRVLNEFSMWYERTSTRGSREKTWRPTAPIPGIGEKWGDFIVRGCVASLNGQARYLAQAGEFFVDWPTMESVPLRLRKGDVEDIALVSDDAFRGGKPAITIITKQYCYFLLTPDYFFEDQWLSVIPFWEQYMEVKDLYIPDRTYTQPRDPWWLGRKSFEAYRVWARQYLLEQNEPIGAADTSRDGPQPGDRDDDVEEEGEEGEDEEEDGEGEGEGEGEEGEEDEGEVQGKGKGKSKPKEPKEPKEPKKAEEHAAETGDREGRQGARVRKRGLPPVSDGIASGSQPVGGTGPPRRLPETAQGPVTRGSKRKAKDDPTKIPVAVRPRHDATAVQEMQPGSRPPSVSHEPPAATSNPVTQVHSPLCPPTAPLFDKEDLAAPSEVVPPQHPQTQSAVPPNAVPRMEGVSQELSNLNLGSQLPVVSVMNLFPPGTGWSATQPYIDAYCPSAPLASFFELEYNPADMSGTNQNVQAPDLQEVQNALQQSAGENEPYDSHVPHDTFFPSV